MKSANILDVIVIVVYFIAMLSIGVFFIRRNKGGKEYFTGGSMIPWWMSGMTLYMANFTAWTFTGAAGFAYNAGWFTVLYFAIGPVAYFIGTQMTAKKWRRTRSISPVEYSHTRYNVTTQQFIGWVISVNYVLSGGVQLAATCKILAPILGFDIIWTVVATGLIILVYAFLGGVWAVSLTDVVQGIILLSITFIVMPLAVSLVGGFGSLVDALPPLTFDHTYNDVHYTEHWLIAILLISSIGFAGGQGQRFYSVADEKSAVRVGRFAGVLALTIPFVFGIPPLVARVLWPDLSQIPWFQQYGGKNPQDLVFVALCLKILPNGLIGVFVAAMLAATMSTLSTVYNMISSVFARDLYPSFRRNELDDAKLLRMGRLSTLAIGMIVLGLALFFVNSRFGIFNQMQAFFTLFNIPVMVPMAFGLLNRSVPRWSAVGSVTWGLLVGVCARYVLSWDIGPQVYLATMVSLGIFMSSRRIGMLYMRAKTTLAVLSLLVGVAIATLFILTAPAALQPWQTVSLYACAALLSVSMYAFARLFSQETEEDRRVIREFFAKIDTPVDVGKEVYAAGKKQVSTLPFVGGSTIFMGLLLGLIFFTPLQPPERVIVSVVIAAMLIVGTLILVKGRQVKEKG
jgi:solute:Na+ symporter, SSS family